MSRPNHIEFYSGSKTRWKKLSNFQECLIYAYVPFTLRNYKECCCKDVCVESTHRYYKDNVHDSMLTPDKHQWARSVEHFYVYTKMLHFYNKGNIPQSVLNAWHAAVSGKEVKRVGKLIDTSDAYLLKIWDEIKPIVMTIGLYAKAKYYIPFAELLRLSGTRELHERIPYLRGK